MLPIFIFAFSFLTIQNILQCYIEHCNIDCYYTKYVLFHYTVMHIINESTDNFFIWYTHKGDSMALTSNITTYQTIQYNITTYKTIQYNITTY